jgi:hypothetical protein
MKKAIAKHPAPLPPKTRAVRLYTAAIAALVFACLVALMWGAYNPHSGMSYETAFPFASETGTGLHAFFYGDDMRIHTSTFYHLSYLLGEALGMRGSYLPYQLVYAILWWARGMLVFVILRRFFPDCLSLCYSAGAFAIVHSSDGSLQWVGQLNQFGFIFWMLLGMYCFVRAWDAARTRAVVAWSLAGAFFIYMSLWSYESQIALVVAFPILLVAVRRTWRKPIQLSIWYAVPLAYFICAYINYAQSKGQSYQESVMRKSWSLAAIAGDWVFNIAASLEFWSWNQNGLPSSISTATMLSIFAALVFAAGWLAIIRQPGARDLANPFARGARSCAMLLAAGLVALTLSFPVYLLLNSARMLWRTQILSGAGAAAVMAAALGLLSCLPLRRHARTALVVVLGTLIVYCGSFSAIQKGAFHRSIWDRYRTAMLEIFQFAPDLQPGAVVILTNVPRNADPFGDNLWFQLAIRLAYPDIPVAGNYYYSDGTPGPGTHLAIEGTYWNLDTGGLGYPFVPLPLERTVVVEYNTSGAGKLLDKLPPFLCPRGCPAQLYDPAHGLITGPVSPIAARRYNVPGQ